MSDDIPSPDRTAPAEEMQWPGTELLRSDWFRDVEQHVIQRRLSMTRDEYVGHLTTVSAYLELPPADRAQVFRRIRGVVPASVEVDADITAHLARRTGT